MNRPLIKILATSFTGATLLALGSTTNPAIATTLTGFSTFGDMMGGMQVTVGFSDGTLSQGTWRATARGAGAASGANWLLKQSGNTFNTLWTFTNRGQAVKSLVINAIPGNTVFDILPDLGLPRSTPKSADGWAFQVYSGPRPDTYVYSDPIDISVGDLFGSLSLYWSNGFRDTITFGADTDSGAPDDPVQPQAPVVTPVPPPPPPVVTPVPPPPPVVINTPPAITAFSLPQVINEGQSAAAVLFAEDSDDDVVTFFLNGESLGTDERLSETRSASKDLGVFVNQGVFTYTGLARDDEGNFSNSVTSSITVLNVAPTITQLTNDLVINEGDAFTFGATATDPGIQDILAFDWDLNNNSVFDYSTSNSDRASTGQYSFADEGDNPINLRVSDGDGGFDYGSFRVKVQNIAPTITSVTSNLLLRSGEWFNFAAAATDPGVFDLLTFDWDLDGNGEYDNFTGDRGGYAFDEKGVYTVGLRVSDGDGGFAYSSFTVETVPEPASVLGLLTLGALGVGGVLKRKQLKQP
jgi:hypothetical protein